MKQELSYYIYISNWNKDEFLIDYPDRIGSWKICHLGAKKVSMHISVLIVAAMYVAIYAQWEYRGNINVAIMLQVDILISNKQALHCKCYIPCG